MAKYLSMILMQENCCICTFYSLKREKSGIIVCQKLIIHRLGLFYFILFPCRIGKYSLVFPATSKINANYPRSEASDSVERVDHTGPAAINRTYIVADYRLRPFCEDTVHHYAKNTLGLYKEKRERHLQND